MTYRRSKYLSGPIQWKLYWISAQGQTNCDFESLNTQANSVAADLDTMLKIDVFVMKRDPLWVEEMRRRVHIAVTDEVTLPIATAEDIILQKLDWYRRGASISDRQWNDVLGVVKVRGDELDMAYLDRWAEPMGLTDLLERALASAQRPSISKRRGEIDED